MHPEILQLLGPVSQSLVESRESVLMAIEERARRGAQFTQFLLRGRPMPLRPGEQVLHPVSKTCKVLAANWYSTSQAKTLNLFPHKCGMLCEDASSDTGLAWQPHIVNSQVSIVFAACMRRAAHHLDSQIVVGEVGVHGVDGCRESAARCTGVHL